MQPLNLHTNQHLFLKILNREGKPMSNQQKRKSCVLYVNYFDYVEYLSEHTYRIIKDLLKEFDSVKLVIEFNNQPIQEAEFKSIADLIEFIRASVQKVIHDLKKHEFQEALTHCGYDIPCIIRYIQTLRENNKIKKNRRMRP